MARTYLSGFVAAVYTLCKYITKYGSIIVPLLDSPEKELFIALQASCNAVMQSSIVDKAKND